MFFIPLAVDPAEILRQAVERALAAGLYAVETLASEPTGFACESPECVTSEVLLLLRQGDQVCVVFGIEHVRPDGRRGYRVRVASHLVVVGQEQAVVQGALKLWEQERPQRTLVHRQLRSKTMARAGVGLN